ncbi:unnamed protein product [Penicillium olsonii]|uniref:Uncharacterized protein n=1 Tax=Penicillium olsonii TaxID=99116 RepID=A0A9W4HD99_PENOL|nr:unnamed protein product [Penicillium olsonii]CAG8017762.1 unnamed protein product [Penicillium olsonii]
MSALRSSESPEEAPFSSGPFSPPTNNEEWDLALVEVKWLCLNQQYKQCYSRCNQLIETASEPLEPIRATYLYYYAATSYEYLGRAAHTFSNTKVSLLTSALENFEAANAALPALLPQPVLDAHRSYSPLSSNPFSQSPSVRSDLSPLGSDWSPALPTLHEEDLQPDTEVESPSCHIWSPLTYSPAEKSSPVNSIRALPYRSHEPFQTPTRPPKVCPSFTSLSASASVATAFAITPPLSSEKSPRPVYDARTAIFDSPSPVRASPLPVHDAAPSPSVGDKLVSFDSDETGFRTGGNVVKQIARMIDSSLLNGSNDPFVSTERPGLRPSIRPPVRLSPIKFPAELEDPSKQIKLMPSPLQIRKSSGDILKCSEPRVVIRKGWEAPDSGSEATVKKPIRCRPPRLPLEIIPNNSQTANTGKTSPSILAPQPKRISPVASPSASTELLATPTPAVRSGFPSLGSPFKTPAQSPASSSMSPYSSPASPDEEANAARAARVDKFNEAVTWLREHIPQDLSNLQKEIQSISRLQEFRNNRTRRVSRSVSFWTFTPVKAKAEAETETKTETEIDNATPPDGPNLDEYGNVLRVETRAQRIARLRKEGWAIGPRSKHSLWKGTGYYDKLCDTALKELGDGRGLTVEGRADLRKW